MLGKDEDGEQCLFLPVGISIIHNNEPWPPEPGVRGSARRRGRSVCALICGTLSPLGTEVCISDLIKGSEVQASFSEESALNMEGINSHPASPALGLPRLIPTLAKPTHPAWF